MKKSNKNDLMKANGDRLRFVARCHACNTKVIGKPSQFSLSSAINKKLGRIECAEFRCPRCECMRHVRIDQISVVESIMMLVEGDEVTKTAIAVGKATDEQD